MSNNTLYIRNRLSLRKPQEDSLYILTELADRLELKKNCNLEQELEKVKSSYPTCTDFERNFPSICFALATGVGKTRLMGAFIAYLYLEKKIKNYFVLAPNLTIYNKLITDFSDSTHPKYVFQGIGEFVHNKPVIVTGDNYQYAKTLFDQSEIRINVFNISKINAETRGGNIPRIKRLSEYLGESYFEYLVGLEDLVLLMDESHHYRADRGMDVINELNPVLGLELTATPQVERGSNTIKFKNVVYEYSLAKAIRDGFVKEPAVATRKDFDPGRYQLEELDRIKLEDGIRIHEDTKVALDIYFRDSKTKLVKPFVLVVAKDTEHAAQLRQLIQSKAFFDGRYSDKVMEIHSSQRGEEKEENIQLLLSLEDPNNKIEIVIHVNMLKEGWDVTNLYTIIPLRTAASTTLREQTIGRGLRLPFGKKTGSKKVDTLTIVSHDKFQEIIDEANKPDSIIKKENVIVIDEQELGRSKEVVTSTSRFEQHIKDEEKRIEAIVEPEKKQEEKLKLEIKRDIFSTIPTLSTAVRNVNELKHEEVREVAVDNFRQRILCDPQQSMFIEERIKEFTEHYDTVVDEFTKNLIEIPRITIQPTEVAKTGFRDFELDTNFLNYQPVSEEILRKTLREQEIDIIAGNHFGGIKNDSPENLIVNELINFPEIDYDEQTEFLFKLANSAVNKFRQYLNDVDLINVVQYHKSEIGRFIYQQMMEHFYVEAAEFEKPVIDVKAFTKIEDHNYSKFTQDQIHDFKETINPASAIPTKIFTGFRKTYHLLYKFDSKTEKDFSIILEQDNDVEKWLRPAHNQFRIYWAHNSKQYHPDFVVEGKTAIYIIETKKLDDMNSVEVNDKARAAIEYCKYASEYTSANDGKPWKYVQIPHNAVQTNMSFKYLVEKFERR
ncbi:MAG: DEAD/DEAH box helicase family protein [Ignavibacteriota bacterium]|nr:type III restriction endonuclease subunit R [Ignavibacteriota bacterium]MCZ2269120.1 DEAD/DEAH box helicase family protein [Ignavibacteriales bacterium]QKK00005.1 MAG: DEAD/DEAH box helicase family protein [Ignavibacteriota bacterium]HOJ08834.1 DEAD/DEAH box helicase family protein [Ignavibacteriaceae bacterium]